MKAQSKLHGQSSYDAFEVSSAGAIIAGTDIMLARDFDSNFVGMIDCTALGLFDGTIIPHYEPENLQMYIQNTEEHILNDIQGFYPFQMMRLY